MGSTFLRTMDATRPAIAAAAQDLAAWLDAERVAGRVAEDAALLARLALDELATNVAMHGGGGHTVRIECRALPGEVRIVVEDDGPAFDPRLAPVPDVEAPLESRRPGGLGILLLRRLSDRFEYERVGDRNRVTLGKRTD